MIGALGACFGRVVTLDSPRARPPGTFQWEATLWHELAHVDHAADVEPAHAALADRGHLGLRGEARASGMGPRTPELDFAELVSQRRRDAAADAERAASWIRRTISTRVLRGIAPRGAHRESYGDSRASRRSSARTATALDTDAAMQRDDGRHAGGRRAGLRRVAAWTVRSHHRRADRRPTMLVLAPNDGARRARDAGPRVSEATSTSSSDSAMRARRLATGPARMRPGLAQRRCCPSPAGEARPRERIVKLALARGDTARGDRRAARASSRTTSPTSKPRGNWRTLLDASGDRSKLWPRRTRVAELDPFDATASAVLGRQALDPRDGGARREFRAALAAGLPIAPRRTAISPRAICGGRVDAARNGRRWRRSRSRRPTRGRRTCCSKIVDGSR